MFMYFQKEGGNELWHEALADHRVKVVAEKRPRYVTVLDVSSVVDDATTKEDMLNLKYFGDFYVDFDSSDIEACTTQVQKFIKKLEDLEVDTDSVRFFASGGKGYHIEVPQQIFVAKLNQKGTTGLPHIYKEMAHLLYVDTLDLRVYSARKGRMWRVPNVLRENGRYKVPVTAQNIKDMDEEKYVEFTSAPRDPILLTTPTLNLNLATMYVKAEQKVDAAAKKRGSAKKDVEALSKFKGEFPPTLLKIMSGQAADDVGFQKIAMQLGITANGLGKAEDDFIALCSGLIANHKSDGFRYNTPGKRETELRRMYQYTDGNVCYSYSVGAVKALLNPGEQSPDLDGMSEAHGVIENNSDEDTDESIFGGVYMTSKGVFKKSEEGVTQVCDLGFVDMNLLIDMSENSVSGIETDVLFKGNKKGRRNLGLENFTSKSRFLPVALENMGVFTGSDNNVISMVARMRDSALKQGGTVYLVHKEGLDLVQRRTAEGTVTDTIWVGTDRVYGPETLDTKYRFKSKLSNHGIYRSDLLDAPNLKGDSEVGDTLDALFNLNEPYVIANMLGWMVACFHRQIYHKMYNQFPLCQVYGQAGSGKSSTVQILMHLFYYTTPPRIISATGNTKYVIENHMQSSGSIPLALEEYKPKEMRPEKRGELLTIFREAYNRNSFGKGGGSGAVNSSWRDIQDYSYSAPIIFVGETMEGQTAVLERTVSLQMSKSGLAGRKKQMQALRDNRVVLSSIGKEIVEATFRLDLPKFKSDFDRVHDELIATTFQSQNDRVIYNIAVVLHGLQFLEEILAVYFEDRFTKKMKHFSDAVRDMSKHVAIVVMPEAAKAMNTLSFITRVEDSESEYGLKLNEDYFIDGKYVHLKIRNVFIKYSSWVKRRAQELLYDNEEAFAQGLAGFSPCEDKICAGSPLKESTLTRVFMFNIVKLETEGVEAFR